MVVAKTEVSTYGSQLVAAAEIVCVARKLQTQKKTQLTIKVLLLFSTSLCKKAENCAK